MRWSTSSRQPGRWKCGGSPLAHTSRWPMASTRPWCECWPPLTISNARGPPYCGGKGTAGTTRHGARLRCIACSSVSPAVAEIWPWCGSTGSPAGGSSGPSAQARAVAARAAVPVRPAHPVRQNQAGLRLRAPRHLRPVRAVHPRVAFRPAATHRAVRANLPAAVPQVLLPQVRHLLPVLPARLRAAVLAHRVRPRRSVRPVAASRAALTTAVVCCRESWT